MIEERRMLCSLIDIEMKGDLKRVDSVDSSLGNKYQFSINRNDEIISDMRFVLEIIENNLFFIFFENKMFFFLNWSKC